MPSADLMPTAELLAAATRALENDPAGALAVLDAQGYGPLRTWVAGRYGSSVERVMLTNGSLQGLALVAEHMFSRSGGRAIVEAPSYDRALLILSRFGATLTEVGLEPDGLDVDAVEAECKAGRTPGSSTSSRRSRTRAA